MSEEKKLFNKWKAYAKARMQSLVAEKYWEDAEQCAYLGLLDAIKTFDPDKGFKFKSYASTCIRNNILNFIGKEKRQTDNMCYSPVVSDGLISEAENADDMLEQYEIRLAIYDACEPMTERELDVLDRILLAVRPDTITSVAEDYKVGHQSIIRDIKRLKSRIRENYKCLKVNK